MARESDVDVVELPAAGVPADQGVSSLGLLMQLAGSVLAAYGALVAFIMLFMMRGRTSGALWLFLVIGLCVARSLVHRAAGAELLYGRRRGFDGEITDPLAGVRRYIKLAIAHSIAVAALGWWKLDLPLSIAGGLGLGLAVWPLALLAISRGLRFSRFAVTVPLSEDKGFEGAAILMTVLGVCGLLALLTVLVFVLEAGSGLLNQGIGIMLMLSLVLLIVRSVMHVHAGTAGLRETSVDRAVELANRYANFGVISSFCVCAVMLLFAMSTALSVMGFALVAGACWMLMAWPLVIRRFFSDRQFADLLAGDGASLHRRAPDAGLTSLGWLLIGYAALGLTCLLPQLIVSGGMPAQFEQLLAMSGPIGARSMWWSAGVIALQAWAGWELLRMGPQHRIIAIAYAVVATAVTAYLMWPMMQMLGDLNKLGGGGRGTRAMMMSIGPVAIQLVLPIATLVLVNRNIAPAARARFRRPVAAAPAPDPIPGPASAAVDATPSAAPVAPAVDPAP